MADNGGHLDECTAPDVEKKVDRLSSSRVREQRFAKTKDKLEGRTHLPTPPPDPWTTRGCLQGVPGQPELTRPRSLEEEDDIIAYLTDLGGPPFEGQTSECPSRNSATSTMPVASLTEEPFEHLDRLYALTEQILELRSRSSRFFKRVRDLEKLKVLRNADRRLERAFAKDKEVVADFCEEDTGFAESLLDAMLSNCRDPQLLRRNIRSPSSRRRSRSLALSEQSLPRVSSPGNRFEIDKQTSRNDSTSGAPKVSKWTRVKAAFKWERACTNDVVDATEATTTPSTPTTKYLRIPDVGNGNWSGSTLSSCTSEVSGPSTSFGRVSSASSSNESSYDDSPVTETSLAGPRKNAADRQSLKTKDQKKEGTGRRSRSLDGDIIMTDVLGNAERATEANSGKPLIRITTEGNPATHSSCTERKDAEATAKRPTPTLTITIPLNEDEIRGISSPESISPLHSSAQNSGGNSPLQAKIRQEPSVNREFKRQRSTMEEPVTPAPKMQRQDSKWNKVRRAFLTNSAFSVPPSPVRVISGQMFLQDGPDTPKARSCSGSVEDLEKTPTSNAQAETRRDYQALREKLGAEFHRKLVEWERLKNISPRVSARTAREPTSPGALNPREGLLPEERLAPEFKKKLQDWKRAKKGRRGSATTFEQQRVSRRRLTDWQLWRSPSKPETRNQDTIGSRGSCGSGGSAGSNVSDGRPHLCEDFIRRMEAWRRMNEATHRSAEQKRSPANRLGVTTGIDESEFLALEKVLSIFGDRIGRERRESDARRLDECFDGETRFVDGAQSANCGNEVLIRTSVGSYRFEGISREFTRKLYDWEKYRGISPRSSTFRLLGPAYAPFPGGTDAETSTATATATKIADEGKVFGILKRSKSAGNVEHSLRKVSFPRHSTSLQSLNRMTESLDDRTDTSPAPTDPQRREDASEDAVDDSEPEAMIVDIEDVIEETASPLKRVQPHQTPVYSVAASETTSIAVPLGTVTSSHEPSPVFLVEVEENSNRKHWESRCWSQRKNFSSEDSPSPDFNVAKSWNKRKDSSSQDDSEHWTLAESWSEKECCSADSFEKYELRKWIRPDCSDRDKDSVKSDKSVGSIDWGEKNASRADDEVLERRYVDFERGQVSAVSSDGESENDSRKGETAGKGPMNSIQTLTELGDRAILPKDGKESMDLPRENTNEREFENQEEEKDGSSDDDEEDVVESAMKIGNSYKQVIPAAVISYSCQLADSQPIAAYRDAAKTLKSSTNCELDDKCVDFRPADRQASDAERHNTFGIITEELQTRQYQDLPKLKLDLRTRERMTGSDQSLDLVPNHKQQNNSSKSTVTFARPIERSQEKQYSSLDGVSTSFTIPTNSTSASDSSIHQEPTIRTTPQTVATCREERCFERIIINEKTLNKIVVPTASTGDTRSIGRTNALASIKDSPEERDLADVDRDAVGREPATKKTGSPTRNVFVKTKRMIFSPFRKSDGSTAGRKGSDASDDDRTLRPKSKSKSRSSSPKITRQDAIMRMPLLLPWPLRPASKEREVKDEPRTDERPESKQRRLDKDAARVRISEDEERNSRGKTASFTDGRLEVNRGSRDEKSTGGDAKRKSFRKREQVDISVQVTPSEHSRTPVALRSYAVKTRENETRSDPLSSDLIHKLNILSNVAARRDGRTNTVSIDSSLESHSSRIRRAKESFLSHRGGPLCNSVLQPRASAPDIAKTSTAGKTELDRTEAASETSTSEETIARQDVKSNDEDDPRRGLLASRPDLVKSASAGMINVDPDTFGRLAEANRGCESLPRTISKRREPSGPFAKIVNKFKLSRLIRGRDSDEGNMSTISRLCRQSLLIDVQPDFEERQEGEGREVQEELSRAESDENVSDAKK